MGEVKELTNWQRGEHIICAAIWYKNQPDTENTYRVKNVTTGVVLCGWRHPYIIGQCSALLGKRQAKRFRL